MYKQHGLKSDFVLGKTVKMYHSNKLSKLDSTGTDNVPYVIVPIASMDIISCQHSTPLGMLKHKSRSIEIKWFFFIGCQNHANLDGKQTSI